MLILLFSLLSFWGLDNQPLFSPPARDNKERARPDNKFERKRNINRMIPTSMERYCISKASKDDPSNIISLELCLARAPSEFTGNAN